MKAVHLSGKTPFGAIIAALCVAIALCMAFYVERSSYHHPTTDSGSIDADVVHVGALVGGRLLNLPIRVNQEVHKGDLLYQIDPEPYIIALHQAEGNLALAQANFEEQQRQLAVKTDNAASAAQALNQAHEERDLAARTVERLGPLDEQHYIPHQQYDQARTRLAMAEATLLKARHANTAAITAIGDLKRTQAALQISEATLEQARYNLRQTSVHASVDGYISSLEVKEGETLAPGQVLFTLIANDEWFAIANLREINLKPVHPGACATVYSMIDRSTPMRGHVESIGRGVLDSDMHSTPRSVPYVARQMDWVHVAQRFPVRIRIDTPHITLLRKGATANIEILHGAACR